MKAATDFTFKTLLRHYAKWALTPRSLNVKFVITNLRMELFKALLATLAIVSNLHNNFYPGSFGAGEEPEMVFLGS